MKNMKNIKPGFLVCLAVAVMGMLAYFNASVVQANYQSVRGICPMIAADQFPDQEGVNAVAGAQWHLCENGDLYIGSGFIDMSELHDSPWHDYRYQINRIVFTGVNIAGRSLSTLFYGLENVTEINTLDNIDTSQVRSMHSMFRGMSSLIELDLASWDTSQVWDMSSMFFGTSSLLGINVGGWDISQVRDMCQMFYGASSLTALDTSGANWDTHQVRDMHRMFGNATELVALDVSGWNTDQVTNMNMMFAGASSIRELDLSNWNTSQVTEMEWMFWGTYSLNTITFGENFNFVNSPSPALPTIYSTDELSGYWQNVGNGTIENPLGAHVLTSEQLMNRIPEPDIYVWQR